MLLKSSWNQMFALVITSYIVSFSRVLPIVNLATGNTLCVIRIQCYPAKVTPVTNLAVVMAQGLYNFNSNAWRWQNCMQSGVISITDKRILRDDKKARRCTGGTTTDSKYFCRDTRKLGYSNNRPP